MADTRQDLLVTGDDVLRDEMSAILEGIGYDVTVIDNVWQTQETLGSRQYEVAVMGESLPNLNWQNTLKTIKQSSRTTRVLMTTRQAPEGDLRSALNAGAYVVLDRPVSQDQISDILGLQKDGLFVVLRD
ncbi:MAG: response regulator [SAR202 cluster bacterium]|jgi:DNA-binding NtrC family response regulator|nr:response regulator [SAR202 cluster bacterium]MDP6301093.1 response regulator [SAR202 cluster bacterium]|tara:strand:+ start:2722 stop:3111 length:390 start_codon:yes stop_codon:yes gene_type:complete